MVAPINSDRKPLKERTPVDLKKVQWVRVRRVVVGNTPVSDPFRFQENGVIKTDKEIKENG